MPISPTTLSELKEITTHFDFLLNATDIDIETIPSDHRLCTICQSPFDNAIWHQSGDTIRHPVKLSCGHIFCIQCLAQLVFDSDFKNRCPLCRAQIIPESFQRNPSARSWKVVVPLLRILMMFGRTIFEKQNALDVLQHGLEREGSMANVNGTGQGRRMHRIMMLYEEFLTQFCSDDEPRPNADTERARRAARRAQRSVRTLLELLSENEEIRRMGDTLSRLELEIARHHMEDELNDIKEKLNNNKEKLNDIEEKLNDVEEKFEDARKRLRARTLRGALLGGTMVVNLVLFAARAFQLSRS